MKTLDGFLLVDKPPGPTSHDLVDAVRRALGIRKVGHAGTLDPFASGLLIIGVGQATKRLSEFVGLDKEYLATLRLGAFSDTMDRTGHIVEAPGPERQAPNAREVESVLKRFTGEIEQIPPMYSAKKVDGRKLYELARQGKEVERKPVRVTIHEIELFSYDWPLMKIRTRVSSGTYIRALAHDIGAALGCGAYLEELRRTKVGLFDVANAVSPEKINPSLLFR